MLIEKTYGGLKKLNFMELIIKIAAEKDEDNEDDIKDRVNECQIIFQKLKEILECWDDEGEI